MARQFFGFAFSASMLPGGSVSMNKEDLTVEQVWAALPTCELCVNPSHKATIEAARFRFGLQISVPEKPASILLDRGDSVIVMQVTGLPRLEDRHEYTPEEVARARFSFVRITVL